MTSDYFVGVDKMVQIYFSTIEFFEIVQIGTASSIGVPEAEPNHTGEPIQFSINK